MTKFALAAATAMVPALAAAQVDQGPANADFEAAFENQTRAPALDDTAVTTETFVDGLDHPWGIALLPGGDYLVTERPGQLRMVMADGTLSEPITGVPDVDNREQGGLLDVAVRDDFAETRRVWLTYAKSVEGGTATAAATGTLSEDGTELTDVQDIFVQSPPADAPMHYGSRIVFEPDSDNAFITTGEHFTQVNRELAQDLGTTYGKVIRVDAVDGTAPEGNPFVGEEGVDTIWSYGHRNIQGAAVGPEGRLWTIEHGPAGGDELNLTEAGENYGWPVVSYGVTYSGNPVGSGDARQEGFAEPVYYWDPVIAPGGMIFYDGDAFDGWGGDILASGLVSQSVVRLELEDGRVTGEERIDVGARVRDVEQAPDGTLIVVTDEAAPNGALVRISPAG
ncbi:PQQ-dependent sugar dehydrogenase [Wenxinia marina]|uniref:Glucose/sorbosone dehydrogenase n=1 Tax=Wenxinia marina DSM 24838 TaxID=1123501 RepID=A0A0D0PHU8_9RHOB|nr:PQQ-dependent sugar dehydrogenase [Wenxinia marina]KIQ70961.1 Glucose/sorbosone dehydrogenase [Wenxinia marina DSM 24838]GGL55961.1 glucose dehydrogenase [Wenxinia marina]